MSQQYNQAPSEPKTTPAGGAGHKGEQDSHAAGSGSSTGDPGKARGQSRGQDTFGTPVDGGAIPID